MKERDYNFDAKYNLKTYFGFLKPYKILFIPLIISIFVFESMQIAEKYVFKIFLDRSSDFSEKILNIESYISSLYLLLLFFIIVLAISTFSGWLRQYLLQVLESKMIFDLKSHFISHLISLAHRFHTSHKTGSLISRLNRGTNAQERMTDTFVHNFLPLLVQTIVLVVSLLFIDFKIAFIMFGVIVSFVGYSYYIQIKQRPSYLELNRREDIEKGNIADVFMNMDSIKYFGKEKNIRNRLELLAEETKKSMLKSWRYYRTAGLGQRLIMGFGTLLVIGVPLIEFLRNEITIGTLGFIYTAYIGLNRPMYSFAQGIKDYYRSMTDFNDLFQYGKIENEIKDSPNPKNISIVKGNIEFNNVSFKYHNRQIINNLSLKIPAGKKIALVGHSGSGKTTLIKLLYRLYDPDEGEILIDKGNIKLFKQEILRSELSIVPQECILFDDTIYNNISFSNPSASREEVFNAIKFAQLEKFIKSLPLKENTIVGERGVKLSGGEKQRVSIARALLADKKILVLDEATSSLDSKTESEIQKALQNLMKGRTSIIIAHRLSTIMNADEIIVLDNGKIVQKGSHSKLIAVRGIYKELWNLQKGGYM